MQEFKPYITLNEAANQILMKVVCSNLTLRTGPNPVIQNNKLIYIYDCRPGQTLQSDVQTYAAGVFTDIIVRIYSPSDTNPAVNVFRGSATAIKGISGYQTTPYAVYSYMQATPTASTIVSFYAVMNAGTAITAQPTEISLLPAQRKLILNYDETRTSELSVERSFSLQDYDPTTYNRIEINIRDASLRKKGKGTTDQDDADSSGND